MDEVWADGILTKPELTAVHGRANALPAKIVSFKFDHSSYSPIEKKIVREAEDVTVDHSLPVIVPSHIHAVQCETTKGPLRFALNTEWAPIGVRRVIDMVNANLFTDHPLYRAIDNFLVRSLVFVVKFMPYTIPYAMPLAYIINGTLPTCLCPRSSLV